MKPTKTYATIRFEVDCYKTPKRGKEEGTLRIVDDRHRVVKAFPEHHFDSYDEIGRIIRECMTGRKTRAAKPTAGE